MVDHLLTDYRVSERRACDVLKVHRSVYRYRSIADDQAALRMRIKEIAAVQIRYGYKRIHALLRREGYETNHKRVYLLYCEEGLNLRRKKPRRNKSAVNRRSRVEPARPDERWSMDFMSDALFNGRRFRVLTVIDNFTRESLAIKIGQGITGQEVSGVLDEISEVRAKPQTIQCDNGPEFASKALDLWA